ncbi:MAG: NADH-quinone oxidoreductase subunit M [Planctomycetota bacterium]|nr:NADH-quinone oxidoreductase subunit M [Planctomycetota bacterium]
MLITLTLLLPLATALVVLLIPRGDDRAVRYTALFGSLATFGFSLTLLGAYDPSSTIVPDQGLQLWISENREWIPSLDIRYHVGVDGISVFMVLLTALLLPICVLCSWTSVTQRVREFHVSLLLLETGALGVFVAMDLVLFYIFWEVMLIPMYLLIGVWGGRNRIRAAVKFIIFTVAGSLLMFLAIIYLYVHLQHLPESGGFDFHKAGFSIGEIYKCFREAENRLAEGAQMLCFLAFALSFAIKVPLFPFHTWLPDAHTEAPTAGSVFLAGVLLKMGTYGFIRFAIPFFPDAAETLAGPICVLAIVGIIFGAFMCLMQTDIKRLIAYSSVSHLGFVMLGIFVGLFAVEDLAGLQRGLTGSLYQMIGHGLSTGALFLLVGIIYERRHTRHIEDFGGVASVTPRLATIFLIATLSSIGVPFLNGFIGEFLILEGTFEASWGYAMFAGTGVILGAVYMLALYRRVFLGEVTHEENRTLSDLNPREMGYLLPLIALMVILGLFSPWFTERMAPSIEQWFQQIQLTSR